MGRLAGKVALVTGASSGIGRGTALRFAKEGAKVVVASRSEDKLQEVVAEIKEAGGEATYVVADFSKEEDNKQAVEVAESTYGGLDIAFVNAGTFSMKPIVEASLEMYDSIFNSNLKSVIFGLKYQIPAIGKRGKGSIVVNTSIMGSKVTTAFSGASMYAASKSAADTIVKYGAIEGATLNVRVNSVAPGIVRSNINAFLDDKGCDEWASDHQLVERAGTPDEIALMATYLASDESLFVTGGVHYIDGGWSLKA
ncbi:unnamed protein product [Choristocarpus tenellus]